MAVVVFTIVIGNADAHGKNLALLHPHPGTVALAPLYDTVPTRLFPSLRPDAAKLVDGRSHLDAVRGSDMVREAVGWGIPQPRAINVVEETAQRLGGARPAVGVHC